MNKRAIEFKNRVISISQSLDEFVTDVDGYVYYYPSDINRGHFSAETLRILADELDRRNKEWDDYIAKNL